MSARGERMEAPSDKRETWLDGKPEPYLLSHTEVRLRFQHGMIPIKKSMFVLSSLGSSVVELGGSSRWFLE